MIKFISDKELAERHKALVDSEGEEEILKFMRNRSVLSKLNRFGNYGSRKRRDLFIHGYLTYAYCYKTFEENNERFRANILFSPDIFVTDHHEILAKVFQNLEKFEADYRAKSIPQNRVNTQLYNDLYSEENDPRFVSIPDKYSEGIYVQLSIVEFEKDFAMPSEPGNFYMLICFNAKISDMVMPYPDFYLHKLMD